VQLISIIIPVYNEAENIRLVSEEIGIHVKKNYEIIFVDDGSTDGTFNAIEEQSIRDHRVKCISFSRNFGHQNALMAGMQNAGGDQVVIMDGDLQHPPALIGKMLDRLDEGFDLVITKRNGTHQAGWFKKITAALFYRFMNLVSETRIEPNVADFKAFNQKVLRAILQFKEKDLFLRGIFSWVGFRTTCIDFDAPARRFGETKYSYAKMSRLASKGITSFSFKPLRIAFFIGAFISLIAFSFAIFALVSYFRGNTVPGWSSTIIAIMFLGGTQLLAIGLLGEYIASLFVETKNRPLFLVDKKINLD
jgi:dolichol-phosphate mannosyltransferase